MKAETNRRALCAAMAVGAVAALAGCKAPSANPAAVAAAEAAYSAFAAGDDKALEALLTPELRNPATMAQLARLRALAPSGPPRAATLVGWRSFAGTSGRQITLTHRYDYADVSVMATTVLVPGKAEGSWLVQTFNLNFGVAPAPAPAGPAAPDGDKQVV